MAEVIIGLEYVSMGASSTLLPTITRISMLERILQQDISIEFYIEIILSNPDLPKEYHIEYFDIRFALIGTKIKIFNFCNYCGKKCGYKENYCSQICEDKEICPCCRRHLND